MHFFKELQIEASIFNLFFTHCHRFQQFNLPSLPHSHKGKTRKPEKVEYFQPPIRLPLSSLR